MTTELVRKSAYFWLSVVWLGMVLTCSSTSRLIRDSDASGRPYRKDAVGGDERAPPAMPPAPERQTTGRYAGSPSAVTAKKPTEPPGEPAGDHALKPFYDKLLALSAGSRQRPVRITWFGDSHTAADFWPHAVRTALFARFGSGGPGFIRLGIEPYRHGLAKVKRSGRWHREPRSPTSIEHQLDGVFGLGGMMAVPEDARAQARVEPTGLPHGRAVRYTLLYRLKTGASFRLRLGDDEQQVTEKSDAASIGASPISHLVLEVPVALPLVVDRAKGDVSLYGVVIESAGPGVVVDTLGINGARLATVLAWDPGAFTAELRERQPDLVILAYGTNEVFDAHAEETYAEQVVQLMARVRQAEEQVTCLVVGPTDVAEFGGGSHPRVAHVTDALGRGADQAGCAFISARELMGGKGSYARWQQQDPPLARSDRVHLTVAGYQELGERLLSSLLPGF